MKIIRYYDPQRAIHLGAEPHGVGMAAKPPRWLRVGDLVTVSIERIGDLVNPVEVEKVAEATESFLESGDLSHLLATT